MKSKPFLPFVFENSPDDRLAGALAAAGRKPTVIGLCAKFFKAEELEDEALTWLKAAWPINGVTDVGLED